MRKTAKVWLIIAASLVVVGSVIFVGVMNMLKWDFTKLSTIKYETNDYEILKDFEDITIVTDTADIVLVPSKDQKTLVVCHEQKNIKHSVSAKDGALVVEVVDTRKWYDYIGINFGTPKITVYIPQGEYGMLSVQSSTGDVEIPQEFKFESIDISESTGNVTNYASALESIKIKTSTGSICVENVSSGSLDLSVSTGKVTASSVSCEGDVTVGVSTGKVYLVDTQCKSVISSGNTGDISLENVVATEKFSIERSTGDVTFDGSDAAEIIVRTDTGNVTGTLLSDKVFITQTDTGVVNVPKTVTGGKCEITTDTGNIKITVN